MKTRFSKKLLACVMSLCMILTVCAGALSVSAAAVDVIIGTDDVTVGETEAIIPVTINANELINAQLYVNVPAVANITKVDVVTEGYEVSVPTQDGERLTATKDVPVEAIVEEVDNVANFIVEEIEDFENVANTLVINFTFAGDFAEVATYPVTLADKTMIGSFVDEVALPFTVTAGAINVVAPAHVHEYTYTNNGDNHTVGCTGCDYSAVEDHTYVEGKCVCGAEEKVACDHEWVTLAATPAQGTGTNASDQTTTVPGSIKLQCSKCNESVTKNVEYYGRTKCMVANALYESAIALEFSARKDRMQEKGAYTQAFVRFVHDIPGDDDIITFQDYDNGYDTTKTAQNRACRTWAYPVKAMQLTETITTNIFVEIDGVWYSGDSYGYSVRSYADEILPTVTTAEKTLVVNMLRYGAKMQVYKGYNAENLADADLASEYAALIKENAPTIEGTWSRNEEIGNDCLQILTSYVLVMDSRTEVRLRVRSDRFTAEPAKNDFVIQASWTSAKGVAMSEEYYNEAIASEGDNVYTQDSQSSNAGRWEFYFAGCPAYDFRQVVTFKLYDPKNPDVDLGNEFSASFEQLISAGIAGGTFKGAELEMYQAMMNYSDAAREYFC